jgi:hypothetical protein
LRAFGEFEAMSEALMRKSRQQEQAMLTSLLIHPLLPSPSLFISFSLFFLFLFLYHSP